MAAVNIGGTTIHTALNFSGTNNKFRGSKAKKELVSMWQNVEYFLIDEHSMLSCEFPVDISKSL